MNPPVFHWSEGLRKPTQIMSQIDGESGADESGGEGEWRVWREADPISGLMSKAGKRAKESHSPCPQCTLDCLCCGDNLEEWEDSLQSTRLRLAQDERQLRIAAESRIPSESENSPDKAKKR